MGASLVLAVSMPVPPQPVEKRREEAPAAAEPEATRAASPPAAEHGDSAPSPAAEGGSQKKAAVDEANALFASAAHRRQGSTSTEGGTPRPKTTGSVWGDVDAASARESADGDDDVRAPLPPPIVNQPLLSRYARRRRTTSSTSRSRSPTRASPRPPNPSAIPLPTTTATGRAWTLGGRCRGP